MSRESRSIANWLLAAGVPPLALGIWVMRESALVAPYDRQHGGAMLVVSGLVFAVPGVLMIVIAVTLRVLSRHQAKHAEPAA